MKKPGPEPDTAKRAEMRALREQGWTNMAIAAKYGVSRTRITQLLGKKEGGVTRGAVTQKVQVTPDQWDQLRARAAELGYTQVYGPGAGRGSISLMMAALAEGELALSRARKRRKTP